MDEKLVQEMRKDLRDAAGLVPPPDHAKSFKELWKIGEMSETATRKALKELIEKGVWIKQRIGNKTFYWKVLS